MLEGIVVAEFGRIFSAPLAGMILSDLGARVIKIERAGVGDESRSFGQKIEEGVSDYFFALNRKKELISLDLKQEEDLKKAKEIIASSDVLIHNSLQNSFDRLGLSYDEVKKINPRIVYAAISGYGAGSRFLNNPSQDVTIQGLSGFMSINGYEDGSPLKTGVPVIDYVTGQYAVIGILAALREREATGKGKLVQVSLLESAVSMMSVEAVRYLNLGIVAGRHGNRHTSIAPYNSYKAKDGYVMIAIANDEMFRRFADAISLDVSGYETNEMRINGIDALEERIHERIFGYEVKDLVRILKDCKVSCEPIHDIGQGMESEEVKALHLVKEEDGKSFIRLPVNLTD